MAVVNRPSILVPSSRDQRSLIGLSKASSVPGRMQTAVASPIGSSTDLNPMVPRPKLWLTNLSATTAGRDLACWRLKSHMVRDPFMVWIAARSESPLADHTPDLRRTPNGQG